jgi:hypothetical protein
MNNFATSSGHWYEKDGTPAYEQPNKSKPGQMRATTLRDAKKLDLVPSVTTILSVAAKPQLERWKLNQLMLAALTLPAVEGESVSEYEARLWEDANAQSIQARDEGTKIHGYIESWFMGKRDGFPDEAFPYITAVETALIEKFGEQPWMPEKSFASDLGFGGKVDLHSASVIVDYKTKDLAKMDMKKSMSYDENKMQLSAYRKGMNMPDAKIANLYISRELQENGHPLVKVEVHDDDLWPQFECLLNYWKLSKGL